MVYYGYSVILFLYRSLQHITTIYNNQQYPIMTNSNSDEREFEEGAAGTQKIARMIH